MPSGGQFISLHSYFLRISCRNTDFTGVWDVIEGIDSHFLKGRCSVADLLDPSMHVAVPGESLEVETSSIIFIFYLFTGGPSVYTFGIDPTADGLVTVDIAANVAQDAAGNDNTAAPAVLTRTYDATSPGVTLASSAPEPTNTAPIPITATFSEAVSGFASGDVSVTNGSVTGFTGGPSVYTFGIDPTADGLVTVDIAANVAQDAAGNDNTAAPAVLTRTYDATSPGVTLASSAPEPTNTAPIPITATFSEAVSGFASGDVSVTNGSVTGFAGGPSVYTFGIDPTADGLVTVDIAANVAQDAAGNDNNAAAQFSITFDGSNPTVTITSSASPGPTFVSPIPITVTFSEDVTGFTTLDLSLSNGTDSNFTVVSGSVYTFDLASIANGLATVDIGADSAFDAAGNGNTAATQFTITFSVNFAPESDGAGAVNGGTATNDVADAETVREDNADPTGLTVDQLFNQQFNPDNRFYADDNGDAFAGVAIIDDDSIPTAGEWQWQDDGAGGWMDVASISDTSALVLEPADKLRFVPVNGKFGNPGNLTARLWDGRSDGTINPLVTANSTADQTGRDLTDNIGGDGAFSDNNNLVEVQIEVTNFNEPPVIGDVRDTVIFPDVAADGSDDSGTQDILFMVTDDASTPSGSPTLSVSVDNTSLVNLDSATVSHVSGDIFKIVPTASTGTAMMTGQVTVDADDNDAAGDPANQSSSRTFSFDIKAAPSLPVVRELPSVYVPGVTFDVQIQVNLVDGPDLDLDPDAVYHGVFDAFPTDWTAFNINEDGILTMTAPIRVKWGPFEDNIERLLTYWVTPPSNETVDPAEFNGLGLLQRTFFSFYGHTTIDLRTIEAYNNEWRDRVFGAASGETSANSDKDFFGEGILNRDVYAFGLDPLVDNALNLPMQEATTVDVTLPADPNTIVPHARISYFRNPSADGFKYVVKSRTDSNDPFVEVTDPPIHLFIDVDETGTWMVEALVPFAEGIELKVEIEESP